MKPYSRAFTLIELLVVVAIIVALLAILMPSMGRALEISNRAICASNQKQLYVATLEYAASNSGRYPRTHRHDPASTTGNDDHISQVNIELYDYWLNLQPIDLLTFTCPNRGEEFILIVPGHRVRIGFYTYFGRTMAGWNHGPWTPWESPQSVAQPGKTRLMSSDVIELNTASTSASTVPHSSGGLAIGPAGVMPDDLGSEGGNFAHTDGSVVWRNQKDLLQRAASGNNAIWGFW